MAKIKVALADDHVLLRNGLAGLIDGLFMTGRIPLDIERLGVLLMIATPVVRVIVACFLFFREKDYRYGWISLGVLVILMLGPVFGIGEH